MGSITNTLLETLQADAVHTELTFYGIAVNVVLLAVLQCLPVHLHR
jgi:hypothetical protein